MDQNVVITLNQLTLANPTLAALAVAMAERGIVLLPLTLGALWLWPGSDKSGARLALLGCAISCALALALVIGLDHASLISRPRPFVDLSITPLVLHAADSSFPSDHTLLGVALAAPLLWYRPRLGVWLFLWALLVGLARVAVGIHYPSDIVGSAVIAVLLARASLHLAPFFARLPLLRDLLSPGYPSNQR